MSCSVGWGRPHVSGVLVQRTVVGHRAETAYARAARTVNGPVVMIPSLPTLARLRPTGGLFTYVQ